jgi:hypothetical protein
MRVAMGNTSAKTLNQATLSTSLSSYLNRFNTLTNLFQGDLKALASGQFTLEKGEVFRVPSVGQELHVLSGIAWVSVAGQDIIVRSGEKTLLDSNQHSAVISPLGNLPLTVEVL